MMYFTVSLLVLITTFWTRVTTEPKVWYSQLPDEKLTGVPKDLVAYEKEYKRIKTLIWSAIGKTGETDSIIQNGRRQQTVQELIDDSVSFLCPLNDTRSAEKPTSVHKIRPGDIDVIGALGDSLTAGNGVLAITGPQVYVENRGVAAIIGGQGDWRKFRTLPNILKEFNPKLIGYSSSDSVTGHPSAGFNLAEPGAMSQDIPFMAKQLVKRIKKDPRVDFQNDWKLVTLFIGANNFCADNCYLKNSSTSIQVHKDNMIKAFQFLRDNMPRTIVNFIQTLSMKPLILGNFPSHCHMTHVLQCPCLFALQHKGRQKEFFETLEGWQKADEEVANDEQFKTKEDFVIILQRLTRNVSVPISRTSRIKETIDMSLFSRDCFHFSQKGNFKFSTALWNNMLEPENAKSDNGFKDVDLFLCPTKDTPYIYTWKNSNSF